jgi:ubiquinone/menaquinone biosynthesis C-methylase UbiE
VPEFDLPAGKSNAAAAIDSSGGTLEQRRSYWDSGWEARFQHDHAFLNDLKSVSDWESYLTRQAASLARSRHVSVVEARRERIRGKLLLDIGCGSGTSGAMFSYFGANYVGVDHSRHAALHTLRHLRAVGGNGFAVQGNAEALPIKDSAIDVVYSNGVLHHTPNFLGAMDEAYRVLKPGGAAIIALYATHSTQFGAVALNGILRGYLGKDARQHWMSQASEGAWRTSERLNPWTQTFSEAELRVLMRKYAISELEFRKNGDPIGEVPRVGRHLAKLAPVRWLDRTLEPLFGSMIIMSFTKLSASRAA